MGDLIVLAERRGLKGASHSAQQPAYQLPEKFDQGNDIEAYTEYVLSSESWTNDGFWESIYDGYPHKAPCKPHRSDMVWYVSPGTQHFGVWVLNQSKEGIEVTRGQYGWNPLVRKSTAPPSEPLNVKNVESRNCVCWIVDEEGYGQYGMVMSDGYVWAPHKKPKNWKTN